MVGGGGLRGGFGGWRGGCGGGAVLGVRAGGGWREGTATTCRVF